MSRDIRFKRNTRNVVSFFFFFVNAVVFESLSGWGSCPISMTAKQQVAERPVKEKTDTRRLSTNPGSGYGGVEKKYTSRRARIRDAYELM